MTARPGGNSRLESEPFPADLRLIDLEALRFRVRSPRLAADQAASFEAAFMSRERRRVLYQKVELRGPAWQVVTLPLRYFRPGAGAHLDWSEVDRLAFRFRAADAAFQFDTIELLSGEHPAAALMGSDELRAVAFPEAAATVRALECGPFRVLTDSAQLAEPELAAALAGLVERVRGDFSDLPLPAQPVNLLIFAREADYRAFWPRYGELFGVRLIPPGSEGYTTLGVAGSACGPGDCGVRPVFVHEAAHVLLAPLLGLGTRGEWLHEGLATRYQLAFSGEDIRPLVRAALDDPAQRLPLGELFAAEALPLNRYWQAALVVEFLLEHPAHRKALHRTLPDLRRDVTTDLRPFLDGRFDRTLSELEPEWLAWVKKKYGR